MKKKYFIWHETPGFKDVHFEMAEKQNYIKTERNKKRKAEETKTKNNKVTIAAALEWRVIY